MTKLNTSLQSFHDIIKNLPFYTSILYCFPMFKGFLFSIFLIATNVASASCVIESLKLVGLDPYTVSYTPTSGFPNENGEVEVTVEVRGSTYGVLVILCYIKNDTFVRFVSDYKEIGQY
jgi:hypothetical protein